MKSYFQFFWTFKYSHVNSWAAVRACVCLSKDEDGGRRGRRKDRREAQPKLIQIVALHETLRGSVRGQHDVACKLEYFSKVLTINNVFKVSCIDFASCLLNSVRTCTGYLLEFFSTVQSTNI